MTQMESTEAEIHTYCEGLLNESTYLYENIVKPSFDTNLRVPLKHTLWGHLVQYFGLLDRIAKAIPDSVPKNTDRLIKFLKEALNFELETATAVVILFRHGIAHGGKPRKFINNKTGQTYHWLLHWRDELPLEKHLTITQDDTPTKKLNFSLLYFIKETNQTLEKFFADMEPSRKIQWTVAYEKSLIQEKCFDFSA
jgi:hypothetical protein